ncbi:MAG TPA: hypothetical protein VGQ42_00605 [Candidatus Dormibacteraeota bacterium]|jgi:hypothetical protein|nr:hypothetical protein [Candidatus Dormibacteraeota bacterium]
MRRRALYAVLTLAVLCAACGDAVGGQGGTGSGTALNVEPQNSTLLVGVNRVSVALLDGNKQPVNGAHASLDIQSGGQTIATRPLQWIGPTYGNKPVYNGTASFPKSGEYTFVVHATLADGSARTGTVTVSATVHSPELPVNFKVPSLSQRIAGDPNTTVAQLDSGVPPDDWHTTTIAQGLAQHRPMLLYFGEPGFCVSAVCGPVVQILKQLCTSYCDRLLFEHIEVRVPPGSQGPFNPAYVGFGLTSEPWIYFVNAQGVVADRFEGPVTLDDLRAAADGTLAGRVPAVDVTAG